MAEIVRVKPQKHYNWHQTKTQVTLNLNIPNTTIDKLSIEVFDVLLIVTNKETKSNPHLFDLERPITKINSRYSNGVLQIIMTKKQEGEWENLTINLPIAELRKRREDARAKQEQISKQIQQKKTKLADEFDRKATQQLMKIEQQERQRLQEKKRKQRSKAEQNVFKDIDAKGNINLQHNQTKSQKDWTIKQNIALQILQKQQQEEKKQRYLEAKEKKKKNNAIFTDSEITQSQVQVIKLQQQFEQIPIRKAQNIKIKLTEKPYPHVAVRQTHFQQPPMPKSNKAAIKGEESQSLEERNPIWLKDKADRLTKNKDYIGAINAYNESLKLDNQLLEAHMNKSYCNMKLFNFDECIADCELILKRLVTSTGDKRQEKIVKMRCRLAICLGWKGKLQQSKAEFLSILQSCSLPEHSKEQIHNSIQLLQKRLQSIQIKQKGDQYFKLKDYHNASMNYNSSIQLDHNEYSLANNALVQLKLNNFQKSIEYCNEAEGLILSLTSNLNSGCQQSRSQSNGLLTKIYLRKGTALKQLKRYEQSLSVLRSIKFIDDKETNSAAIIKEIEYTINKQKYTKLKQEADNYVKSNNLSEALKLYKQCLGLLTSSDLVQYLSVLLNQCVCYIKLQNYNEIVAVCIRGLKLVNSTMGVDYRLSKQEKEKITEFKVRFLVRKAKAYICLGQYYNAESDVKQALKIQIGNQRIKKQLQQIRKQIVSK